MTWSIARRLHANFVPIQITRCIAITGTEAKAGHSQPEGLSPCTERRLKNIAHVSRWVNAPHYQDSSESQWCYDMIRLLCSFSRNSGICTSVYDSLVHLRMYPQTIRIRRTILRLQDRSLLGGQGRVVGYPKFASYFDNTGESIGTLGHPTFLLSSYCDFGVVSIALDNRYFLPRLGQGH